MSEAHLRMRLTFGWVVLWGELLDCQLLEDEALRVLSQRLGLCMNQSRGFRNLYIHNFSTIGGLLFLL